MTEQISLSDFDFNLPDVGRSKQNRNLFDVAVTWRNKGRMRKNSYFNVNVSGLARREKATFKEMAVGANKFKRGGRVLLVFNNTALRDSNAPVRYDSNTETFLCSSKAHAFRLLEEFGIEEPNKPDTGLTFYLRAEKIEGQPNVYVLKPVSITHMDASGKVDTKQMK